MSETNKIMTSLQFPGGVEPYVINDARIPQNPDPYMQLVTDGEGKAGWEQRLGWKEGEKVEIFWDGNTEGLETVNIPWAIPVYHVSDQIWTDDQIKNGVFVMSHGTTMAINEMWDQMVDWGTATEDIVLIENGIVFVRVPNVTFRNCFFPTPGVYFGKSPSGIYIQSLTTGEETIHPIPAEYLPEGIGGGAVMTWASASSVWVNPFTYTEYSFKDIASLVMAGKPIYILVDDINMYSVVSFAITSDDDITMSYYEVDGSRKTATLLGGIVDK